jgi:hypothetical protein
MPRPPLRCVERASSLSSLPSGFISIRRDAAAPRAANLAGIGRFSQLALPRMTPRGSMTVATHDLCDDFCPTPDVCREYPTTGLGGRLDEVRLRAAGCSCPQAAT